MLRSAQDLGQVASIISTVSSVPTSWSRSAAATRCAPAWHAEAIRAAFALDLEVHGLSKLEAGVLAAIAYEQPITRAALSQRFGREISRDLIAALRDRALIAPGPRAPTPGAPFAYVTTRRFLETFGLETLGDLPDLEALQDAGLVEQALE